MIIFLFTVYLTQLEKKSRFGKSSLSIAVLVIILRFLDFKFHSLLFSKLYAVNKMTKIIKKSVGFIMLNSNVVKGTVKWFNETKGFGFIQQESGPDVFAHFSEIASSGFKTLFEGQQVEFSIAQGQKGPNAVNIVAI